MELSPKDLLVQAKNLINTEGWIKCQYHIPNKGYCMIGAIQKVIIDSNGCACPMCTSDIYAPHTDALEALSSCLPQTLDFPLVDNGDFVANIITTNDHMFDHEQQVLDAFDQAVVKLDG